MAGGTPHGRIPIGNGVVKAADIRAVAKENRPHPSNSMSVQSMAREMACLRQVNASLESDNRVKDSALQQGKVITDLVLVSLGCCICS
jgi:hypothetical protein